MKGNSLAKFQEVLRHLSSKFIQNPSFIVSTFDLVEQHVQIFVADKVNLYE